MINWREVEGSSHDLF